MEDKQPSREDYLEALQVFARHVDAVEQQFDTIRYPGKTPTDLELPGYDAYEMPDSLVGRVVSGRFDREVRQNVDRVAAALVLLRLTTEHIETLCTLALRPDAAQEKAGLLQNIALDKQTFDGLLEGYVNLLRNGDTAETLGGIRHEINEELLSLTQRFENAAVKQQVPYDLATMEKDELIAHGGVIAADYASTAIKLQAYKLVNLKFRLDEHIALYKHLDEGALTHAKGIDDDYEDVAHLTTVVIDECRTAQAAALDVISNAYDMIEGKPFRPIRLDYTL
jgi:hypothetical protein